MKSYSCSSVMKLGLLGVVIFLLAIFQLNANPGMDQKLGFVFPLQKKGDRVLAARSLLINENQILPKGSFLRVAFLPPAPDDADVKRIRRKDAPNPAFSRQPNVSKLKIEEGPLTPEEQAAQDRALNTIWREKVAFRAAFERWDRRKLRLVFQKPGSETLEIDFLRFPEGMLLAEENGKIVILFVEKNSSAQKAGILPGNVLQSLNGRDFGGSLASFQKIYLEEKAAKQKTDRKLNFVVLLPESSEEKNVAIHLPRSLSADIWSDMP